jgi:hypothetical protein
MVKGTRGEVHTHIRWGKDKLIAGYTRQNCAVFRVEVYVFDEECVPFSCCGTEDSCALENQQSSNSLRLSGLCNAREPGRGMEACPGGMYVVGDVPPPYAPMRAVLIGSCLSKPRFSTSCCAMTSPVAKSTCQTHQLPFSQRLLPAVCGSYRRLVARSECFDVANCVCGGKLESMRKERTAVVTLCVRSGAVFSFA